MSQQSNRVFLKDYTPPAYLIESVALTFELDPECTVVTNTMKVKRGAKTPMNAPLVLDGEMITLISVSVDGKELSKAQYQVDSKSLTISSIPAGTCAVQVKSSCAPIKNTALEGLYVSSGMFCTQNEPEGFRRITYFIDRSDIMATYRTTIIADAKRYPVLLSNGNLVESGSIENGKLRVTWEDPFPKPSYLFALVAGDLGMIEGTFIRRSGRPVTLRIYTDKGNEKRCYYGLECLKRAMKWDEDTFGLEYDLDIFMIVAVNDFNFGAMENKGLNIFSARAVLADSETATDDRLVMVDAIIAHEYFHNWTGDRVTCRDWFQLTLKEGLTVLRDQLYTADVTDADEKRIVDALEFERDQFPEDAGPLAHPIQPKSFVEINNFYTTTVYDKGAEVIRMMRTIIGKDAFRRGIDKYFELNDGKAVTTEDFVSAIELGGGADLKEFRRWYHQSGTPEVRVQSTYDSKAKEFCLTLSQRHPVGKFFNPNGDPLPPQNLVIPFAVGLIGAEDGKAIELDIADGAISSQSTRNTAILMLSSESQTFRFKSVAQRPVVSCCRGFSAPVRVVYERPETELATLLSFDTDSYARWRVGQDLFRGAIVQLIAACQKGAQLSVSKDLVNAFSKLLDAPLSPGLLALMIDIPAESTFTDLQTEADFESTHTARCFLIKELARATSSRLREIYDQAYTAGVGESYRAMGSRRLALKALSYLLTLESAEFYELCDKHQRQARNMTEEFGGLLLLADSPSPLKVGALSRFYEKWKADPVVSCSWITAQAVSSQSDTIARCLAIEKDPVFVVTNPSKVLALYRNFASNQVRFNALDGSGYRFIADAIIRLDAINPNMSAMISKSFTKAQKLPAKLKSLVRAEFQRILAAPGLSKNAREVIEAARQSIE